MEDARNRLFTEAGDVLRYVVSVKMDKHEHKVGSPIERLFLESLLAFFAAHLRPQPSIDDEPPGKFHVSMQVEILEYRVDFLIHVKRAHGEVKCVVECDGHEFHERTKEQAARDRKRDRDLQGAGYMVLRFTGSQIYREPFNCVGEAIIHIMDVLRRTRENDNA